MEFSPEKVPENTVLPFILKFDFHIVVDPHDTLFCPDSQGTGSTGELITVEVHCQIIFPIRVPILFPKPYRCLEREKAVKPRRALQHMDWQLLREPSLEETAFLKEEKFRTDAVVIQILKQVEQALLNSAGTEVFLKKSNPE